jgi:hypothetical protein
VASETNQNYSEPERLCELERGEEHPVDERINDSTDDEVIAARDEQPTR